MQRGTNSWQKTSNRTATGTTLGTALRLGLAAAASLFAAMLATSANAASDASPSYSSYKVTKDVTLTIQKIENGAASTDHPQITLKSGTTLTVLDVAHDATIGDIVRLGLDASVLPSDFWVRANDLIAANLQSTETVTNDRDPLNGRDVLMKSGARLGSSIRAQQTYAAVKKYLVLHKIVPVYLPGHTASEAASILPRFGLAPTSRGQRSAKIGDVCVLADRDGQNGLIEILRAQGWWQGDDFHAAPTDRSDLHLLGCFAK